MLRKVLVANRGEIARRVMRTCRALGVATVAVYSEADADAPHVREADEAVLVGPAPAARSYLDIGAIVAAAQRTGADAIHPGYGFLSENAAFAEACAAAGLVFVGPSPDAIRLMGDKAAAKRRLAAAGVPTVPGVHDEGLSDEALAAAAEEIGYPVLVKAVAGGGGKGMRAVTGPDGIAEAVEAARREALAAFGDDRLLLERLVARPRHVEIQVFGDQYGNVVHLFERECSVQRRHQKVVEEAPSPVVDADLRARMGAAAVAAAQAVEYVGAGTVEFLLDADGSFYFLEMNTRLQVEHPVTEMTTGTDLVAWQLRVAAGEPLPATQDELSQRGHAIEVRLYAEDPSNGFLPQVGPVLAFRSPPLPSVRVDAGVEAGSEVSRFYDPMLGKLIAWGEDRPAAIDRLRQLLSGMTLLGVTTNLDYLDAILAHPTFRAGDATTAFIEEELADWAPAPATDVLVSAVAAGLARRWTVAAMPPPGDPASPWARLGPWRSGRVGGWHIRLRDGDRVLEPVVVRTPTGFEVALDGTRCDVGVAPAESRGEAATVRLRIDGDDHVLDLALDGDVVWARLDHETARLLHEPATRHADAGALAGHTAFTAPMPGAVVSVRVSAGDVVAAGTTLVVVEAMKMEHPIKAPVRGTVSAVHVAAGDAVDAETVLVEFDPEAEGAA